MLEMVGGVLAGLLAIAVGVGLYVLPTLVAWWGTGKRNVAAIAALNVLAGWTVVGWIVALVWALMLDDQGETNEPREPARPVRRRRRGGRNI